jgi:hypothetical protein
MESLDKHHETNAEALEDNCCVQGNAHFQDRQSRRGSLAVASDHAPLVSPAHSNGTRPLCRVPSAIQVWSSAGTLYGLAWLQC